MKTVGFAESDEEPVKPRQIFAEDSEGSSNPDVDEVCSECGLQGEVLKCEGSTNRPCNNFLHKECMENESPMQCQYCKRRDNIQDTAANGEQEDENKEDEEQEDENKEDEESSDSEHSTESEYSGHEGMRKPKAKAKTKSVQPKKLDKASEHQGFAIGTGMNTNPDGKSRRILSARKQKVMTPDPKRAMTRSRGED